MSPAWTRAIVLTPRFGGADGVSAVSRLYARALSAQLDAGGLGDLEIWSLADADGSARLSDGRARFRGADGSRMRLALLALGERRIGGRTLVIVQHVHLLPVALPLAWRGARLMLLLHGVEAWKPLRALERAGCRLAWKIAAVSAHSARRFKESNPQFADRVVHVCAPGLPSLPDGRPAGVPGPYALIVGRMAADERYKGHDLLIEVWPAVRRAVPDARLVIAGGGDDRDRLHRKAAQLGLGEAVQFEGVVSAERLAALYRDAAIFVMPSPNEGFGLVYVEAMSAGVPCVVAAGAAEEIVEHGSTGLVVPPADARALRQAIVGLLARRDVRDRMGAAAAESARRRFSLDAFAGRLYDILSLPPLPAAC